MANPSRRNVGVDVLLERSELEPVELAEIAEIALVLGLAGLAQVVLNAAYDRANGFDLLDISVAVANIKRCATAAHAREKLTERQIKRLEQITVD